MSLPWVPSALPAPVIPRSPRFHDSSPRLLPRSSALLSPRPAAHPGPLSSQHSSRRSQPATPVQPPGTFLLFLFIPSSGEFYFCLLFVLNALGQTSLFVFVLLAWVCPQVHSHESSAKQGEIYSVQCYVYHGKGARKSVPKKLNIMQGLL